MCIRDRFVGSVQKGRFVPEHHLFTAFGAQCANREELTLADPRCVEYLSGREVEARTAADGWCCVTVDGWPLGGGKVSGGRVKNHYPDVYKRQSPPWCPLWASCRWARVPALSAPISPA